MLNGYWKVEVCVVMDMCIDGGGLFFDHHETNLVDIDVTEAKDESDAWNVACREIEDNFRNYYGANHQDYWDLLGLDFDRDSSYIEFIEEEEQDGL